MPKKTPDDYMREMMEQYRRSNRRYEPVPAPVPVPEPEPVPVPSPPEQSEPEEAVSLPEPETVPDYHEEYEGTEQEEEIMPQYMAEFSYEKPSEYSLPEPEPEPEPEETSFGWIQVSARTAGNALPLEGVSVMIYREKNGGKELAASLVTDSSGNTQRVKLPAPPVSGNPSQAYSTYEIKAFLPGYTRMESVSVPVFSNTASIQAFELIPLPQGTSGEGPVITNSNTEPKY